MAETTIHADLLSRLASSPSTRDKLVARLLKEKLGLGDTTTEKSASFTTLDITQRSRTDESFLPMDQQTSTFRPFYTLSLAPFGRDDSALSLHNQESTLSNEISSPKGKRDTEKRYDINMSQSYQETELHDSLLQEFPQDEPYNYESLRSPSSNGRSTCSILSSVAPSSRFHSVSEATPSETSFDVSSSSVPSYATPLTASDSSLTFSANKSTSFVPPNSPDVVSDNPDYVSSWKPKMTVEQREMVWREKMDRYKQILENREKKRLQLLEKEAQMCTFKPEIHHLPGYIKSPSKRPPRRSLSVPTPPQVKGQLVSEQRQREMKECTFSPDVGQPEKYLKDRPKTPLHERVGDIQKEKRHMMNKLKAEAEQRNPELTYKPKISDASAQMAHRKHNQSESHSPKKSEVYQRLSSPSNIQNKIRNQKEMEKIISEECTFHPKVSEESRKMARAKSSTKDQTFYERQMLWQKQKIERDMRTGHETNPEPLFHPRVSETSQKIVAEKRFREGESQKETVERLSSVDSCRREAERQKIIEESLSQYTFKPELNEVTKSIGKSSTLHELASKDSIERARRKAYEDYEKELKAQLTFQPSISPVDCVPEDKTLISRDKPERMWEKIETFLKTREGTIEKMKAEMDEKRMKEYTFRPSVNEKSPAHDKPVYVKGLGRYLETVEHAKNLREDKKAREDYVFSVHVKRHNARTLSTTQRPKARFKKRTEKETSNNSANERVHIYSKDQRSRKQKTHYKDSGIVE